MKNKFTPGPWKKQGNIIFGSEISSKICKLYTQHIPLVKSGFDEERANASLISAAPELYKALDKAYLDILNIINQGEFKEGIEWNSGYIEDALKKARGE